MKILHLAPHLDGLVGKAHAAIAAHLPEVVQQTFVLLTPQRDPRPVDMLRAAGARVLPGARMEQVAALARAADIVQFEFWSNPRLLDVLARCAFPAMRSVVWSHGAELAPPAVLPGLLAQAGRFVFAHEAARAAAEGSERGAVAGRAVSVIDSRFGLADAPRRRAARGKPPAIAYFGPTDLAGMQPAFFDAVDRLVGDDIRVSVWGTVDETAATRACAMRHPERIVFRGEVADRAAALCEADLLFHPLAADHDGAAATVLVEAMSLGLVPVVLGAAAEAGIVRDSETGFVANSVDECVSLLQMLLLLPELRERIAENAARHVAETCTPARAAQDFLILWLGLLSEEPKPCEFRRLFADAPAGGCDVGYAAVPTDAVA